jgi:hypothetical protein
MYAERIVKGMDMLDRIRPGWRDMLNLDVLDQSSPSLCVAGQTGGYWELACILRGEGQDGFTVPILAPYGLALDDNEGYRQLTKEWLLALS